MPSIADLKRAQALNSLGLSSSTLSTSDLEALVGSGGSLSSANAYVPDFNAIPVLSGSPPAVSTGTGASAIAGSVLVAPDEPGVFSYLGATLGKTLTRGAGVPDVNGISRVQGPSGYTSPSVWIAEFILDTADATGRFEVKQKGQGGTCRVVVQNKTTGKWEYVSDGATWVHAADGISYYDLVTLGAPGVYRIRLEFYNARFYGIHIGPTDTLVPVKKKYRKIAAICDSFGDPTFSEAGTVYSGDGWFVLLMYMLDVSICSLPAGSTGWLADGIRARARTRVPDFINDDYDEYWWCLGINDAGANVNNLVAEAVSVIGLVKSYKTASIHKVFSPWSNKGITSTNQTLINFNKLMKDSVKGLAVYVDTMNRLNDDFASDTAALTAVAGGGTTVKIPSNVVWPDDYAAYVELGVGTATVEVRKYSAGSWTDNGDGTATITFNAAGQAHAIGDKVRRVGPGFITGTGRVGALAADGNADRYVGSDSTHPTRAGHKNIAYVVAYALAA